MRDSPASNVASCYLPYGAAVNRIKVHITFTPGVSTDAEARAEAVAEITRVGGMTGINQKRLESYSLLSGLIDESTLDAVRAIKGVRSVEPDRMRHLK